MARTGPEVADVFRRYGDGYRERHDATMCTAQRRVMTAIERCRTAALGGHVEQCDQCGHQRISFNSCLGLNRFAVGSPCQGRAWICWAFA
jgi:Transposase zinc-binding domain